MPKEDESKSVTQPPSLSYLRWVKLQFENVCSLKVIFTRE